MKVLLTNDDGIGAQGLQTLRRALLEVPGIELATIAPNSSGVVLETGGSKWIPVGSVRSSMGSGRSSAAVTSSRRGAFMSLSACTRDLCTGAASIMAGRVVVKAPDALLNVGWLGWIAAVSYLTP